MQPRANQNKAHLTHRAGQRWRQTRSGQIVFNYYLSFSLLPNQNILNHNASLKASKGVPLRDSPALIYPLVLNRMVAKLKISENSFFPPFVDYERDSLINYFLKRCVGKTVFCATALTSCSRSGHGEEVQMTQHGGLTFCLCLCLCVRKKNGFSCVCFFSSFCVLSSVFLLEYSRLSYFLLSGLVFVSVATPLLWMLALYPSKVLQLTVKPHTAQVSVEWCCVVSCGRCTKGAHQKGCRGQKQGGYIRLLVHAGAQQAEHGAQDHRHNEQQLVEHNEHHRHKVRPAVEVQRMCPHVLGGCGCIGVVYRCSV